MTSSQSALAWPAIAALALGACADGTGPGNGQRVSVAFAPAPAQAVALESAQYQSSVSGMQVSGSNGTLTITDVGFVVAELELEAHDGACDGIDKDGCPDFEAPPQFVQLPLTAGGDFDVASTMIPPGAYQELRFEVETLEADQNDDQAKRTRIAELLSSIRSRYSDFPARASMVVAGQFNGTPFRVYFDAEIEVDIDIVPALTISGSGASRSLTVQLQPDRWFRLPDGTVRDLSQHDFARTGQVLEFSLEIEKAFVAIDVD